MKLFNERDTSEILEVLGQVEEFRLIIRQVLDALKSLSPEIQEIPNAILDWAVKRRIASVKKYEEAGFSREEAILMTLDDTLAQRRMASIFKYKNK